MRISGVFQPLLQALIGLTFLVVLWYGGGQVLAKRISLGSFVMFNTYMGMLVWPMIALGWVVNLMQRGGASLARINQIFHEKPGHRRAGASGKPGARCAARSNSAASRWHIRRGARSMASI